MLVFIDESGDPGFKLTQGSSPVFVLVMILINDNNDAQITTDAIQNLRRKLGFNTEFKFNKSRDDVKQAFFETVKSCPFKIRAVVIEKAKIRSSHLREEKTSFYNFFLKTMLHFNNGRLKNARVMIDGSGDKSFRQGLAKYIRKNASENMIEDLRFKDSHKDPLIQLADMCAGAIARSYRVDRPEPKKWLKLLRHHIEDIWEFE
jgi:Protein of unknown function (DUF3800)